MTAFLKQLIARIVIALLHTIAAAPEEVAAERGIAQAYLTPRAHLRGALVRVVGATWSLACRIPWGWLRGGIHDILRPIGTALYPLSSAEALNLILGIDYDIDSLNPRQFELAARFQVTTQAWTAEDLAERRRREAATR